MHDNYIGGCGVGNYNDQTDQAFEDFLALQSRRMKEMDRTINNPEYIKTEKLNRINEQIQKLLGAVDKLTSERQEYLRFTDNFHDSIVIRLKVLYKATREIEKS